ncbi:SDR family oxidoreductase [Pseudonocardia benzenivorans]|uniref:NAD-dependent epimerase/dehydratase n=2 Tax=Pseudonocardia TaxID=1847 RepID=F4CMF5_PSEUX|nr:SDR family oxidoreductase [Pseudonocardia dioxanivorans]AEA23582.1 NAD-dependent epimerase/dehydratase [Pseudonocardia dioxanivorans CB1190]GJF07539.1 oxidoreductase [Pseudonocardia sp. D17]
MHVFVTGGSGWVGRGLVPDLLAAGHQVTGLARSTTAADALRAAGAAVLAGSLDDLDVLREGAAAADGVVHLGFKHDIAFAGDYAGASATDRAVVEVFGEVLAGTGNPLVIASGILGVLGLAPGVVATERDGLVPDTGDGTSPISGGAGRIATAHYALALADRGVRSSVVRLPPATHGNGDNGLIATAVGFAREKGAAAYVGDGANRWPAVHRDDAARLFRLALESAPAGSVLHAVGEEGVPIRAVAEVVADHLGVPAVSVTADEVHDHVGWLGGFWSTDGPASAELTCALVDWKPTGPTLVADLEDGHYYA